MDTLVFVILCFHFFTVRFFFKFGMFFCYSTYSKAEFNHCFHWRIYVIIFAVVSNAEFY